MRRNYRGYRKPKKKFNFSFNFHFNNKLKKVNKMNNFKRTKNIEKFKKFEKHLPIFVATFSILLIVFAVVLGLQNSSDNTNIDTYISANNEVPNDLKTEDADVENSDVTFTMSAVGNISSNASMCSDAFVQEDEDYDFFYIFNDVYRTIKLADVAICNLNTNFGDINKGGSPDNLANNLKRVGFDVLSTAGSHSLDGGFDGLSRTIDVLNDADVSHVGTYKTR